MTFPPNHVPTIDDVDAELCRRSYRAFVREAWPHVPHLSGVPFVENWHVAAECEHLEAVAFGDIRYLLINQPPRSSKTEMTGVFFLPWIWTWNPGYSEILSSIKAGAATQTAVRQRSLIVSPWYQALHTRRRDGDRWMVDEKGDPVLWSLLSDKNAKNDFANDVGGAMLATSLGSEIIGMGADLIVGDDLESDGSVQSDNGRRVARDYWDGTLSSRARKPSAVAKILVQQRLHVNDLSWHLMQSGLYTHLFIPTEYDPRRSCVTVVAGREWRDPRTELGELLNPLQEDQATAQRTVVEAKTFGTGMGPAKFRAQHNQDPKTDQGGEIRRTYWRFYRHPLYSRNSVHRPEGCLTAEESPAIELPVRGMTKILSVDSAVKENQTADYSVVEALIGVDSRVLIWDFERERTEIPGLIRMYKRVSARNPDAKKKYVEDKSSGSQLIQLLKKGGEVDGVKFEAETGLVAVDPGRMSKVERTRLNLLPRVEAGEVYLPEGAPWLDDFVAEHAAFPLGDHDDQIDATAQGCAQLTGGGQSRAAGLAKW